MDSERRFWIGLGVGVPSSLAGVGLLVTGYWPLGLVLLALGLIVTAWGLGPTVGPSLRRWVTRPARRRREREEATADAERRTAQALRDAQAFEVEDPAGRLIRWDHKATPDGCLISFWSDARPPKVDIVFTFDGALDRAAIHIAGEELIPRIRSERPNVVHVRFEHVHLGPDRIGELRVFADRRITSPPQAEWWR